MSGLKNSLAAFNAQLQHPWHIASNYKIFAAVLVEIGVGSFDSHSTFDILEDWAAVLQVLPRNPTSHCYSSAFLINQNLI
jgi:hypothetical protein